MICLALSKRDISQKRIIIGVSVLAVLLLCLLWFSTALRIWIFAVEILVFLALEFSSPIKAKSFVNLYRALAIFAVAWGIWWLDLLRIWDYKPLQHVVNGHAIWHVLTAVSLYFLYKFYRANLILSNK